MSQPTRTSLMPKLRFREFRDEWRQRKLGDIATFIDSRRVPLSQSDRQMRKGKYPYYGASGVIDYVDGYLFSGEYVLLGEDGANIILRSSRLAFIAKGKFWVNNHAHVMQAKGSSYFLAEYLETLRYDDYNTGTAQPKLNATVCKEISINTPTIREQEKIASFLMAVDDKITALQAKIALLQKYKKGTMQAIFTQKIRFKDENGNHYPEWRERELGSIFDEVTRKVGESNAETYSITAGLGFVTQRSKFGKDISGNQNKNYTLLHAGEFSYNKGNSKSYSYGCIYSNKENKPIAVPNVFISFKLKDRNMAIDYFESLFSHHYLDKSLREIISSGARMDGLLNVGKSDFFKIKVPVPSIDEQRKIANFLTVLDNKIKLEESKLEQANKFKKSLLQQMFV